MYMHNVWGHILHRHYCVCVNTVILWSCELARINVVPGMKAIDTYVKKKKFDSSKCLQTFQPQMCVWLG